MEKAAQNDKTNEPLPQRLSSFLDPANLSMSLQFAALFIAVFDYFKDALIERVKNFYLSGIKDGKPQYRDYDKKVLSKIDGKKNKTIRATLKWLQENGAFSNEDIKCFKELTNTRNALAHNMAVLLFEGLDEQYISQYVAMLELFSKFDKWWIAEIEIPTDPDMTPEVFDNIDWDGLSSMGLVLLKMMTDAAINGNDKYTTMFAQQENELAHGSQTSEITEAN